VNTEAYIASGILEGYVMGWATEEEILEVESYAKAHPEIKKEIEHIQGSLEDYAIKYSKTPPPHLKAAIWSKIKEEKPVIPIQNNLQQEAAYKNPMQKYLVAASLSLLAISTAANIYLYSRYHTVQEEVAVLNAEKTTLANQFKIEQTHYNQSQSELSVLKQPEVKIINLKGLPLAPTALATIYWNTNTKEVYLNINKLPAPADDKQYQLWAIVDGKPIDAGIFEVNTTDSLQKMKSFQSAQAFAVTLENKGGSQNPTMEAMYVMGQI
jgi:anti-sigma-K factor RskA